MKFGWQKLLLTNQGHELFAECGLDSLRVVPAYREFGEVDAEASVETGHEVDMTVYRCHCARRQESDESMEFHPATEIIDPDLRRRLELWDLTPVSDLYGSESGDESAEQNPRKIQCNESQHSPYLAEGKQRSFVYAAGIQAVANVINDLPREIHTVTVLVGVQDQLGYPQYVCALRRGVSTAD